MKDTEERLVPEYHLSSLIYGEHLARYVAVKSLVKGKRVVDVASGTGYGTFELAQTAKEVTGLDISNESVEFAQKNYKKSNLEYKVASAYELPFEDESVDVVISFETIEHLEKYQDFTKEVKRILKKNGFFIVSTPNDDEFIQTNHYHVHQFNLSEYTKFLKGYFPKVEINYQGSWKSTAILSEKDFVKQGDIKPDIIVKTFPQDILESVYFIAVCAKDSTTKLPAIPTTLSLSEHWSDKKYHQDHKKLYDDITKLHSEVSKQLKRNTQIDNELSSIKTTRYWRLRLSVKGMFNKLHIKT